MLADLTSLASAIALRGDLPDSHRDALLMIGVVESKGGDLNNAVAALSQALAIVGHAPLAAERFVRSHHLLAEHLSRLKLYDRAAEHFQHAIDRMPDAPAFSVDQRLGTMERRAFVLHEARRFTDALECNIAALASGEELHGENSASLMTLVINIAQNLNELDRKAEAVPYLKRALQMSRDDVDEWREQDLLFQLGVLAFETGRPDEARQLMLERIRLIEEYQLDDMLQTASQDLAILEEKLAVNRR